MITKKTKTKKQRCELYYFPIFLPYPVLSEKTKQGTDEMLLISSGDKDQRLEKLRKLVCLKKLERRIEKITTREL